jgi:predicted aminopeptidase
MLANNYARKVSDKKKREEKARIFASLKAEYQTLRNGAWGGYAGYDRYFAEHLNNAHLASVATYNDFLPGFRALLAQEKSFPRFYAAVQRMKNLSQAERQAQLLQLAQPLPPAADTVATQSIALPVQ